MKKKGRFIVIEGPDGSGKSTLAHGLEEKLVRAGVNLRVFREPGGALLSEKIRFMLRDPDENIGDRAELLLFLAARAQLCEEEIIPALERGEWVLLDRWEESTLVYQGVLRGLGEERVEEIARFARGDLEPDRVLVLRVPAELSKKRMNKRGDKDRIEAELSGKEKVAEEAYAALEQKDPEKYHVLDASGSPKEVTDVAWQNLKEFLE